MKISKEIKLFILFLIVITAVFLVWWELYLTVVIPANCMPAWDRFGPPPLKWGIFGYLFRRECAVF